MRALVFQKSLPALAAAFVYTRASGKPALFPGSPLRLQDVPDSELPGDKWVRVGTRLSGVCGSDMHLLRLDASRGSSVMAWRDQTAKDLVFPGHETVGVVLETGPAVEAFRPGDRVVLVPGFHCRALGRPALCRHCESGSFSHCEFRNDRPQVKNFAGGWSQRFLRHESQLIPCPSNVPDELAVLTEPAASGLHCVLRRPPRSGNDSVLVYGAGTIGLSIIAALRAIRVNARIVAACRHAFQEEMALRLGATAVIRTDTENIFEASARVLGCRVSGSRSNRVLTAGYDVVYNAVGSVETINDCLRLCRVRGTTVLEGIHMHPGTMDCTPIWHGEVDLIGSSGFADDEWEGQRAMTLVRTLQWMSEGRLDVRPMLTHSFSPTDYRAAITTAADKKSSRSIKVAFDFTQLR
jgi:L-iditol 2-dehydrogenase